MISILRKWPVLCCALILTGCGGGSSQITNPTITLTTPSSSTLVAGSTLQLRATVTNSDNTTVLWYVNNIAGGNSFLGTITPQGLYTAPSLPPQGGIVIISAAPQAFPIAITSITIGITFGSNSLNSNYVFTLNGAQGGSPWAATGSFTGSNGSISNGIEDINGPSGVAQALPFTGSYVIAANGQGTATFNSAQGSVTLTFTLNSQGQAVAMRSDAGSVATGFFYPQLPTALTLANLNAPYVFSFTGSDSSTKPLNVIGAFITNGSTTLASAEEDINDGGTTVHQTFNGIYTSISNGHGTATFTNATGTRSYSFYVVSPAQLQFIETDASGHLSGTAFQQQAVTPSTTLSGLYVFYASGYSGSAAYGNVGGFSTNATTSGNINAGTDDINTAGTIVTNASLTGSFNVGPLGRGTLTLSGASGANNYVYYLITPTQAFLLSTPAGINASGQLYNQTGGFVITSLYGNYILQVASPVSISKPFSTIGLINLDGVSAVAGSETVNTNGTISGDLAVTGTYALATATSTTSTRGIINLVTGGGATTDYVFYPISSSAIILMGDDSSTPAGTMATQ
ncbi:MAG: beta strand repeat-containing protein [Gammaproteobacteria bacterium]